MRQIELFVGGLGCRRCVREVTARLRDVPGVQTVVADARAGRIVLGGTMSAVDVLSAFSGTTYLPRIVQEGEAASGPA